MVLEIPLWIIGTIAWFSFMGFWIYLIISGIKENDMKSVIEPTIALLAVLLSGLAIGCNTIWQCSDYVRFV